jgi:GTP cyclohydrolase III
MSIQMIALRNSFDRYMRQSEVRIGQLREVVERIQRGEKVDVEKALGTGDEKKEADWEEGMQRHDRKSQLAPANPEYSAPSN